MQNEYLKSEILIVKLIFNDFVGMSLILDLISYQKRIVLQGQFKQR